MVESYWREVFSLTWCRSHLRLKVPPVGALISSSSLWSQKTLTNSLYRHDFLSKRRHSWCGFNGVIVANILLRLSLVVLLSLESLRPGDSSRAAWYLRTTFYWSPFQSRFAESFLRFLRQILQSWNPLLMFCDAVSLCSWLDRRNCAR